MDPSNIGKGSLKVLEKSLNLFFMYLCEPSKHIFIECVTLCTGSQYHTNYCIKISNFIKVFFYFVFVPKVIKTIIYSSSSYMMN